MKFNFQFLFFVFAFLLLTRLSGQDASLPAAKPKSAAAQLRRLTVDDYFRINDVEDAQISPDGKWVAYVVTTHNVKEDKDKKRIWMVTTSGGDAIPLTPESANSTRPRWSLDGKYLAFVGEKGSAKKQVWLLHRDGGEAEELTNAIQDVEAFEWSP